MELTQALAVAHAVMVAALALQTQQIDQPAQGLLGRAVLRRLRLGSVLLLQRLQCIIAQHDIAADIENIEWHGSFCCGKKDTRCGPG